MENMNVHYIEAPYVKKSDSVFGACTTRRIAQISSWILVIGHGCLFAWLYTLLTFRVHHMNDDVGVIWDISTQQFIRDTEANMPFGYDGELFITNIQIVVGLGFSILLVYGVHTRNTSILTVWIIYFVVSCGVMIVICIFQGEGYSSFKKMLIVKLICLNFIIFIAILSYFKELREENLEESNTRQIKVTVAADPIQPHLPLNTQNHLDWPVNHNVHSKLKQTTISP